MYIKAGIELITFQLNTERAFCVKPEYIPEKRYLTVIYELYAQVTEMPKKIVWQ